MHISYPKWLYHATEEPKIVKDPGEHATHDPSLWLESPADHVNPVDVALDLRSHPITPGSDFQVLDSYDVETGTYEPPIKNKKKK